MRARKSNFAGGKRRFSPTPLARSCWSSLSLLPLLVVFVVGIFDFGGAFNLKQMLNNIAREGARFASSLPTNDLDAIGTPPSVTAIRDLVVSHLQTAQAERLRSGRSSRGQRAGNNVDLHRCRGWLRSAPGADHRARAIPFPPSVGGNTFNVISTRVSLKYPYSGTSTR